MMRQRVYDTIAIGKWLALIGVTAALLCGCAAHVATTNGAPPRAATPIEQALAYNDSLAQANKSVAQGVVNATNVTPPLIPVPTANRILIAQSRIADFDRQLTPLLQNAASVSASSAQIQSLLAEIKAAATPIAADLGIADAKTQQEISRDLGTVVSMSDLVLQALQRGGLLK
jgi:hypothetical protein